MAKVSKVKVDLQNNTDRTVYATWNWTKEHTKEYSVKWYYATGDGIWFVGTTTTVTDKQSTYNAPNNATSVCVRIKPVSTTHKVTKNKKTTDVAYWTADWSAKVSYAFKNNPPDVPSVPKVTINKYKLTAEVDVYDTKTEKIEFQVVKNDKSVVSTGKADVKTKHATYTCNVSAGTEYKVRCRGIRGKVIGAWSEYSDGDSTIPAVPSGFTDYKATSATSVWLDWTDVSKATSYVIEYTTKKAWFGSNSENVKKHTVSKVPDGYTHAEITGLDTGQTWWFRLQAINDEGESGFCDPISIKLGKAPAAPTTWSSTATAMIGDEVTLYWVHNSEDGSSQTYAEVEWTLNGVKTVTKVKNSTDDDLKDKISSCKLSTLGGGEGATIDWRVRTRGVLADYGDWSIMRTITLYSPATLTLNSGIPAILSSYPLRISATAGPSVQHVIQFFVSITANETYETLNFDGTNKWVNEGEEIYAFHTSGDGNNLNLNLLPSDVNLDNGVSYTLTISVAMDSGLSAELYVEFEVGWEDEMLEPNAEIGIDDESVAAYITPYCLGIRDSELLDSSGNKITDSTLKVISTLEYDIEINDVYLSVYRREYDGTFMQIATDLDGNYHTTVTDPHPSLDLARYRIVAISKTTGAIGFYDVPGVPVYEPGAILQWAEDWISFDPNADGDDEVPAWSGSMLRLPYNVDVSDNTDPDVTMVNYIGRKHPVSYYGTQKGVSSTWNMDIDKSDSETLYALRRLSVYSGDVYVRESSGSGYWANVKVSFSQKHTGVVIPVTLTITRVEGGA